MLQKFSFNNGLKFPELKSFDTPKGRFYKTPYGTYPSVTTILSDSKKDNIKVWENKVGKDEADKIKNYSASRGTQLHNITEKYLKNEKINWHRENPVISYLFDQIQPFLDNIVDEIFALEKSLFSTKLEIAGRVDLISKLKNGSLCVIDFKTTDKPKYEEYIDNYKQQVSVYSYCFEEMFGHKINNCIIVMCIEKSAKPSYFTLNEEDIKKYLNEFKKIRSDYKTTFGF